MGSLVVIGASSVALNVLDIAAALGRTIAAFVDETRPIEPDETVFGVPIDGSLAAALARVSEPEVAIAIGDNHARGLVDERVLASHPGLSRATLIHPAANISPFATVAPGAIIMAGCHISARASVGRLAYFTANTAVGHSCVLGDRVSMNAGASLGGWVVVGDRTMLGLTAAVREKVRLGSDALVGAGSFVNSDVADGLVVAGTPARTLRTRHRGERYLR